MGMMTMAKPKETQLAGRFWVDKGGSGFLGRGRVELLERIAEHGSISAAARAMKMSYKAAWEAVDAMNNLADEPLVERSVGGRHGGGTRLTAAGRRTINLFRVIEEEYRRFLGNLSAGISDFDRFYELMRRFSLKTSARNQFRGEVAQLTLGAVNAELIVDLPGGIALTSILTIEAVESLGLKEGMPVHALFQESSVLVAAAEQPTLTARNCLHGHVVRCQEGAVNGEVTVEIDGGQAVTAIITNASIRRLGLKEGAPAWVYVKASDVLLAVND